MKFLRTCTQIQWKKKRSKRNKKMLKKKKEERTEEVIDQGVCIKLISFIPINIVPKNNNSTQIFFFSTHL